MLHIIRISIYKSEIDLQTILLKPYNDSNLSERLDSIELNLFVEMTVWLVKLYVIVLANFILTAHSFSVKQENEFSIACHTRGKREILRA